MAKPVDSSLGEDAAIGRIHEALFGGGAELVRVGRYEIRELIGAGAFGKVYRARDPNLDRDVALKILTTDEVAGDAERDALLREARTMAALGHPNIAAVHDAGIVQERGHTRAFIAMELVAGADLRAWLAREPRSIQAILDVLVQVGRGLAAAHAAGITHRDLKPENVLVGDDGRVRVVDFGLARATAGTAVPPDLAVTSSGIFAGPTVVAGTPAYMAPEQLAGAPASPVTDQFSFCATAWEALHGQRPFPGRSVDELRDAMTRSPVVPLKSKVPVKLRRVLERGLAAHPETRFPSMDSLLELLAKTRASVVPMIVAGVAIAAIAVVGFVLLTRTSKPAAAEVCARPTKELDGVWDPQKKAQIEKAFKDSGVPFSADTYDKVSYALEGVATGWLDAKVEVCEATNVKKTQSPDMMDRRMACLDDVKRQLRSVTDAFATPNKSVVENAQRVVGELSFARCSDTKALASNAAALPADAGDRKKVEQLSEKLAQARTLQMLGKTQDAWKLATEIAADPATQKYAPLAIATALWQSDALVESGKYAEGSAMARQAFDKALAADDKRSQVVAAVGIAKMGGDPAKKGDALQWTKTARELTGQIDNSNDLKALIDAVEGAVDVAAADPKAAEESLERASSELEKMNPKHPELGGTLSNLAWAEAAQGKLDEAGPHMQKAIASTEAAYGPNHPQLATMLGTKAGIETSRGKFREAIKADDRAIDILASADKDDARLIQLYASRGQNRAFTGDPAGADRDYLEATRIAEASPGQPMLVELHMLRAELLARDPARVGEAVSLATQSRKAFEGNDLGLAFADAIIARTLAASHRPASETLPVARGAAATCTKLGAAVPANSPCPLVYQTLGQLATDAAEKEDAFAKAEQAILKGHPDPLRLVEVRAGLADARVARDHDAAMEIAKIALAQFPPDGDPKLKTAVETWIAQH